MKENKKLRVWWNSNGDTEYFKVEDINDAIRTIKEKTDTDLRNDDIVWNAYGLEVFEDNDWQEYSNDDGEDIAEIIEELDNGED